MAGDDYVDIDPSLEQEDVSIDEVKSISAMGSHVAYTDGGIFGYPKPHYVVLGPNLNANNPKDYSLTRVEGFFTKSPVYVVTGGQAVRVYPGKSAILVVRVYKGERHVVIEPYSGG